MPRDRPRLFRGMAMDQKDLRLWEAKCTQEEPPRCQAACPLHVDARALCAALGEGRVDAAWAAVCRTLPLAPVLARICDAPCTDACLRAEAGGAVDLGDLERFLARSAGRTPRPRPLPKRGKTAAVLGGGLAGLVAANDLALKGFAVTLVAREPGAALAAAHADDLPGEILAGELEHLAALGVDLRTGRDPEPGDVEEALAAHDAVFADPQTLPPILLDAGEPDALTLGTTRTGLFAAPPPPGDAPSPILLAALGRRAAGSMDRFAQGASLTAGREREGAFASRLSTDLAGVEPAPPVPGADADPDAARAEAARCLRCQCLQCVRDCAFLEHYTSYPKVYARRIYNNASIVMGTRQANGMINSCMLCGLCEAVCPEGFDMGGLCLEARRDMVARGKMPPSAHEFALRDMAHADSGAAALTRGDPDGGACATLFFPGCQLSASDPGAVERAYAHLRGALPGGVGLMLRCCGAPARWAGREDLFEASLAELRDQWRELGGPVLATACPTCAETLRRALPEAEIRPLWDLLAESGLPAGAASPAAPLAVHDPCAARGDEAQRNSVRALLAALGCTPVEPRLSGELTECCGFGGLLDAANPELGAQAARRRAAAASEDFVTYCAMCRDMLARADKRALHVLDLLFPAGDDPAARPAPGHSRRRENRTRLKERLLSGLWREPGTPPPPHEAVRARFTDQAIRNMEDRRILEDDVRRTLLQARESGTMLENAETGRLLACFRPANVTYWVECEADGPDGWTVHNAWCHRMRILGGAK